MKPHAEPFRHALRLVGANAPGPPLHFRGLPCQGEAKQPEPNPARQQPKGCNRWPQHNLPRPTLQRPPGMRGTRRRAQSNWTPACLTGYTTPRYVVAVDWSRGTVRK